MQMITLKSTEALEALQWGTYLSEGLYDHPLLNVALTKPSLQYVDEQLKIKKKNPEISSHHVRVHNAACFTSNVPFSIGRRLKTMKIHCIRWLKHCAARFALPKPPRRPDCGCTPTLAALLPCHQKVCWSERSAATQNRKRAVNSPLSMKMLE